MSTRIMDAIPCCCCCCFLLLVLLVIFCGNHSPFSFEVKRLYVPGLDKSLNYSTNASIIFDISLRNRDEDKLYFDPINVTFYEGPRLNHPIANFTTPEFSPGEDRRINFKGMVNTTGLDFDGAKQEISANGFKVFRVGMETAVSYNIFIFWKGNRHEYRKSVDVKIGDTGAAPKFGNNFIGIGVLALLNLVVMF